MPMVLDSRGPLVGNVDMPMVLDSRGPFVGNEVLSVISGWEEFETLWPCGFKCRRTREIAWLRMHLCSLFLDPNDFPNQVEPQL